MRQGRGRSGRNGLQCGSPLLSHPLHLPQLLLLKLELTLGLIGELPIPAGLFLPHSLLLKLDLLLPLSPVIDLGEGGCRREHGREKECVLHTGSLP